jgi:hypothetical protein
MNRYANLRVVAVTRNADNSQVDRCRGRGGPIPRGILRGKV